jgi:hypothetical protein
MVWCGLVQRPLLLNPEPEPRSGSESHAKLQTSLGSSLVQVQFGVHSHARPGSKPEPQIADGWV